MRTQILAPFDALPRRDEQQNDVVQVDVRIHVCGPASARLPCGRGQVSLEFAAAFHHPVIVNYPQRRRVAGGEYRQVNFREVLQQNRAIVLEVKGANQDRMRFRKPCAHILHGTQVPRDQQEIQIAEAIFLMARQRAGDRGVEDLGMTGDRLEHVRRHCLMLPYAITAFSNAYQTCLRGKFRGAGRAAAPLPQVTGPPNLLTSRWNLSKIAASLLPREQYQPFRDGWDALPQDARAALIASGERALKGAWDVLPASMALEFARNGNRSRYEALRNRRRTRLQELVMAERLEGKGRFTDEIVNGVWLTCEETFWGVPAHLGAQKAGVGLPDVTEPIVDLFAAETAGLLAWTLYLLEGPLRAVSPLIPERIRLETDRRVLTPAQTRDFSWMGFAGHSVNNWDPWICSNWLTAALLVEREEPRRALAVYRILRCLDNFLNSYADDGGCDEGPSYWGRAGASLFDCLELLHQASSGALQRLRPAAGPPDRPLHLPRPHRRRVVHQLLRRTGARLHQRRPGLPLRQAPQ